MNFTAPWGGLYLHHDGFSTTGYQTLRFALHGGSTSGKEPSVGLFNASGASLGEVPVTDYVSGNVIQANQWYNVIIPLTYLNASNTTVSGFMLQSPTVTTMYLDDVRLSDAVGSSYDGGSGGPPPVSSILFGESIGTGWQSWSWGITYTLDTARHYTGATGLTVTYQNPWSALSLGTAGYDTTGTNTLTFKLHGGSTGGQRLLVRAYDAQGTALTTAIPVINYVAGRVITPYVWHEVRIPVAHLNATNRVIINVELMTESATTVTYDDLKFEYLTDTNTGVCNE